MRPRRWPFPERLILFVDIEPQALPGLPIRHGRATAAGMVQLLSILAVVLAASRAGAEGLIGMPTTTGTATTGAAGERTTKDRRDGQARGPDRRKASCP